MNSSAYKIGRALNATLLALSLSLPLSAQMGSGGMHGGATNTPMDNSGPMGDVPANGQDMPGSPAEMSGNDMAMGRNVAPFVDNNTVYTLTRERPSETADRTDLPYWDWVLAAFNLSGVQQWRVTLSTDQLSAPTFGPDGRIVLVGRNGMRAWTNQFGLGWPREDRGNLQRSSVLYIVSPGPATAAVKEVKIDGEWASPPVVATSASLYSIYLTTTPVDFELAIAGQGPMHDSDDVAVQRFLYVFSPDGANTAKTELK
ncbi:MAG: hypothetical protein AB1898_11320 [Acidobacteriota bacterium]